MDGYNGFRYFDKASASVQHDVIVVVVFAVAMSTIQFMLILMCVCTFSFSMFGHKQNSI